jgi:hypothetical protein
MLSPFYRHSEIWPRHGNGDCNRLKGIFQKKIAAPDGIRMRIPLSHGEHPQQQEERVVVGGVDARAAEFVVHRILQMDCRPEVGL